MYRLRYTIRRPTRNCFLAQAGWCKADTCRVCAPQYSRSDKFSLRRAVHWTYFCSKKGAYNLLLSASWDRQEFRFCTCAVQARFWENLAYWWSVQQSKRNTQQVWLPFRRYRRKKQSYCFISIWSSRYAISKDCVADGEAECWVCSRYYCSWRLSNLWPSSLHFWQKNKALSSSFSGRAFSAY